MHLKGQCREWARYMGGVVLAPLDEQRACEAQVQLVEVRQHAVHHVTVGHHHTLRGASRAYTKVM